MNNRRGVGRTRHRLAERIQELLDEHNLDFKPFDGSNLIPVDGYYRSQDVYRWESTGLRHRPPGLAHYMSASICSWVAMTTLIRSPKLILSLKDPMRWEVDPA